MTSPLAVTGGMVSWPMNTNIFCEAENDLEVTLGIKAIQLTPPLL